MKILMIAPQPFFQPRGTPISVYQRLQGLSSLEYEVDLLTYHVGKEVNIPGVSVHRILNIPFIKNVKIGPSWPKLFLDILLFYEAVVMLITNQYDVIHSHEEAAFFSNILAAIFHKPHLYDMHSILSRQVANSNFGNYRLIVKLFEILERWVVKTCDAVITIGSDLEAYIKEINPAAEHVTIENLPLNTNGTQVAQYLVTDLKTKLGLKDKIPIVYTGTFEPYQGLDLLFRSAEIVKQHTPKVSFVLVGGNPDQVKFWRNEVRKKNLDECTLFIGTVPPEEVLTYLEMADILVSPRTEGLSVPLKVYSYLSSGKPIVATQLISHTQVLSDETAVLVERESEKFAEGIIRLIQNPDLRLRLGRQAQRFAKRKFNFANYSTKLNQIYEALDPQRFAVGRPVSSISEVQNH